MAGALYGPRPGAVALARGILRAPGGLRPCPNCSGHRRRHALPRSRSPPSWKLPRRSVGRLCRRRLRGAAPLVCRGAGSLLVPAMGLRRVRASERGTVYSRMASGSPVRAGSPVRSSTTPRTCCDADDDRTAVIGLLEDGRRRTLTHGELFNEVSRLAAALRDAGVRAGDRVAGFMPNLPETLVAMLATAASARSGRRARRISASTASSTASARSRRRCCSRRMATSTTASAATASSACAP
jgi:hypothetical protein